MQHTSHPEAMTVQTTQFLNERFDAENRTREKWLHNMNQYGLSPRSTTSERLSMQQSRLLTDPQSREIGYLVSSPSNGSHTERSSFGFTHRLGKFFEKNGVDLIPGSKSLKENYEREKSSGECFRTTNQLFFSPTSSRRNSTSPARVPEDPHQRWKDVSPKAAHQVQESMAMNLSMGSGDTEGVAQSPSMDQDREAARQERRRKRKEYMETLRQELLAAQAEEEAENLGDGVVQEVKDSGEVFRGHTLQARDSSVDSQCGSSTELANHQPPAKSTPQRSGGPSAASTKPGGGLSMQALRKHNELLERSKPSTTGSPRLQNHPSAASPRHSSNVKRVNGSQKRLSALDTAVMSRNDPLPKRPVSPTLSISGLSVSSSAKGQAKLQEQRSLHASPRSVRAPVEQRSRYFVPKSGSMPKYMDRK